MEDTTQFLEGLLARLVAGSESDDLERERDLWRACALSAGSTEQIYAKLRLFQRLYWPTDTPPATNDLEGQLLVAVLEDMRRLLAAEGD